MDIGAVAGLSPPPVPGFVVERPRLAHLLDVAARHRLSVVRGPAGSGKTVMVSQWAGRRPKRPAWLTLTRRDNDPRHLATRLVAALATIDPEMGSKALGEVDATGTGVGQRFLQRLLEDLEFAPRSVLVLDDFQVIDNRDLLADLAELVDCVPSPFHFVVGTRRHPDLDVGRLRERGQVVEIGSSDLAFDPDEVAAVVANLAGRLLTRAQVDALTARTEGWPVAVQLAGLSLRTVDDVDGFIDRFSGDHDHVASYLTHEVLSKVPASTLRFLTTTSVLRRLSGPLCDTLTGDDDGTEMLEALGNESLLVDHLDLAESWYRYHPFFRDVLRRRLREEEPDGERLLLQRAARWHAVQGDPVGAAGHLIEAEDWGGVLQLVGEHALALFEQSRAATVEAWLDAVPPAGRAGWPQVALWEATLATMSGKTVMAERVLQEREAAGPLSPGEAVVADAIRILWLQWQGSPELTIEIADRLLDAVGHVTDDEVPDVFGMFSVDTIAKAARGQRARAQWLLGDVEGGRAGLRALYEEGMAYPPWQIHCLGSLALIEAWNGHLARADQYVEQALDAAGATFASHPSTVDAYLAMAHVLRERNLLAGSEAALARAAHSAVPTRRSQSLAVIATEQALVYLADGSPDQGLEELDRFLRGGHPEPASAVAKRRAAARIRLLVASGEHVQARMLVDGLSPLTSSDLMAAAVQAAVARHDLGTARELLDGWPGDGELRSTMERGLWTAIVEGLEGDRRIPPERLADVVSSAEADGHVRLFLDAGPEAVRLLRSLAHTRPTPYVRQLLAHCEAGTALYETRPGDLTEPLSGRELAVIRFLATPLSNAEIAARLYVSLNTLKSHLRSIYRKMGVRGRRAASQKAEDLGLA